MPTKIPAIRAAGSVTCRPSSARCRQRPVIGVHNGCLAYSAWEFVRRRHVADRPVPVPTSATGAESRSVQLIAAAGVRAGMRTCRRGCVSRPTPHGWWPVLTSADPEKVANGPRFVDQSSQQVLAEAEAYPPGSIFDEMIDCQGPLLDFGN